MEREVTGRVRGALSGALTLLCTMSRHAIGARHAPVGVPHVVAACIDTETGSWGKRAVYRRWTACPHRGGNISSRYACPPRCCTVPPDGAGLTVVADDPRSVGFGWLVDVPGLIPDVVMARVVAI